MQFFKHSDLEGSHAFLSASNYHWLNYDEEKLVNVYANWNAAQRGSVLHDFAKQCILLNQKLPDYNITLNMYVNDAIGFGLTPEQVLYYSEFCFGTADSIGYKNGFLRIHDLKTGSTPAHFEQLRIYAAIFFLEYGYKPEGTDIELRLYQNDAVSIDNPKGEEIRPIMNKIIQFDKIIKEQHKKGLPI